MHHARVALRMVGEIQGKIFLSEPGTIPHENDLQSRLDKLLNYTPDPNCFLIDSYVKSGTHWCWEIMLMLLRNTTEVFAAHKESMFLEMANIKTMAALPPPHVYNTHFEPIHLPEAFQNLRTVFLIRNLKDVVVSIYYHLKSHKREELEPWTWDEHFQLSMDSFNGKVTESWFDFNQQAWDRRGDSNKLLLFYEDLVLDVESQIRKLATFMGITVTDELVKGIASATQIDTLRAEKSRLDDTEENKLSLRLFRKGRIGDWKNHLTVAQNEELDSLYHQLMQGYEELDTILQPYM